MGAGVSRFRRYKKKRNSGQNGEVVAESVSEVRSSRLGPTEAPVVQNPKFSLLETPRPDDDMQVGVPDTPIGYEANIYRYYCPLCMLHFKSILKTKCCNHYICLSCCMDYMNSKGIVRKDDFASTIAANAARLEKVHCPNCSTQGFSPQQVDQDDIVRDYSRNNEEKLLSTKHIPSYYQASPVRRGETFEDLKRKMIPYGGGVGIADVVTPESVGGESNDDQHKRSGTQAGGAPLFPDVEGEEEGECVAPRRLFAEATPGISSRAGEDTDDGGVINSSGNTGDSERLLASRSSANVVAASLVGGILAEAVVHK